MSTNDTKKRNRIWLWIGALVLVIAIVGAGFLFINNRQNAAEGSEAGTGDIVTAFIGDLSTNATASGEVVTR